MPPSIQPTTVKLEEALRNGLRLDSRSSLNRPFLNSCVNGKVSPFGLTKSDQIVNPITHFEIDLDDTFANWPLPMLFRGEEQTLLIDLANLYVITEGTTVWTSSDQTVYNTTLESESLTNGAWTSDASDWTLGGGWTWVSEGYVSKTTGNQNTVYQENANMANAFGDGELVRVIYKVQIDSGSIEVAVSTATGTSRTSTGTYTEDILSDGAGRLTFTPSADFVGQIDYVSVKILNAQAPSGATLYHHASFRDIWFLANESRFISYLPSFNWLISSKASTEMKVNALARSHNRLFLGGLSGTRFAEATWLTIWETWLEKASERITTFDTDAMDTNVLMWSTQVGGQFYWPFISLIGAIGMLSSSDYTKIESDILQSIEDGELGILPMRWRGDIEHIKQLGEVTMVYGEFGITAINQDGTRIEVLDHGPTGRGCVGGDERQHIFIDGEGVIWRVGSDLSLERLGYEEYFSSVANFSGFSDLVISFDPQEGDYYICNDTKGYLLNRNGLVEQDNKPTSLLREKKSTSVTTKGGLIGLTKREEVLSSENVTNGSFTGNATGWDLAGGFAYDSNKITHTPGIVGAALQSAANAAGTIVQGRTYKVVFTISGMGDGEAYAFVGTLGRGSQAATNSTFTEIITALGDVTGAQAFGFSCSANFDGSIDDVSVKEYIQDLVLVTEPFDNGQLGIDTIREVVISAKDTTGFTVAVDYRYDVDSDYTRTTPAAPDGRGVARPLATGVDFRIALTAANMESVITLDGITVYFKGGGKVDLKKRLQA